MSELNCFSDLKILDISQGVAGPYCTSILWQHGAEIIKVEPLQGDWSRHIGTESAGQSALSLSYNIGKKSISLDAKSNEGRKIILKMVSECDVFIQNFRPGVIEKMGLAYEELIKINPNLVYLSISGYGSTGPYSFAPATDSVMQAETGIMSVNNDEEGRPQKIGILMVDVLTGMYAAQQVMASLLRRQQRTTSEGEHIELNLFDACLAFQLANIVENSITPLQGKKAVSAPNGVFRSSDNKLLNVLALNNEQFEALCNALGKECWLIEEKYKNNNNRMENKALLHTELEAIIAQKEISDWLQIFSNFGVLHAPVRDYEQIMQHPQTLNNETIEYFEQDEGKNFPFVFVPGLKQKRKIEKAPSIGENSVEILKKLKFDEYEIDQLLDAKVVYQDMYS